MNFHIENLFTNFTKTFYHSLDLNHINKEILFTENFKEENFDFYFEIIYKLLYFIKKEYHPKIIHIDIISTLEIFEYKDKLNLIDINLIEKLKNIINFSSYLEKLYIFFIKTFPGIIHVSEKDLITRYFEVLNQMKLYFV